jgi:REP element-mobilizing transposase RayT
VLRIFKINYLSNIGYNLRIWKLENSMEHKHLHHIDLSDHYQFITFRTHDSVDSYVSRILSKPLKERKRQLELDEYLDQSKNGSYLNGRVLSLLYEYLIKNDSSLYKLSSFCIIPNHVHILIKPMQELSTIMKQVKGGSAYKVNKMLNKKGRFWADGYFDKLIRDERHFNVVYKYIKNNPRNLNDRSYRFYSVYE